MGVIRDIPEPRITAHTVFEHVFDGNGTR